MALTPPQPPWTAKEDEAMRKEGLWQEFFSDPSQWWDSRSDKESPRSPDFRHRGNKEVLWIKAFSPPPRVKPELSVMIQGQAQSGDGSNAAVHHGPLARGYNGIAGLNQVQLFESDNSPVTTGFERGARAGVNKNSYGSGWSIKTPSKAGQLKETLHTVVQGGISPDTNTYVYLLQECIKITDLAMGKQVHTHIIQSGFKPNIFLLNTLVNMYAKCGNVVDARQVFDRMLERDVFTWTTMMAGYAKHAGGREALEIYEQMIQEGVTPNRVTFTCVLNVCANLGDLGKGKDVHEDISKSRIVQDIILENTLVDMYAKCGSIKDARQVFDSMTHHNVVSWNSIIAGYTQLGFGREALEMYEQMIGEGLTPNKVTFICVLNACASLGALDKGKEVRAAIDESRVARDIILENTLVDMYAKCGSIMDARQVFDNMAYQDVVSWNAMIGGYAQHGSGRVALEMYERMIQEGVTPNKVTFICVLNASASLGALENGKKIHADIMKAGIVSYINLENTLVDMYAKCGSINDARRVFDKMSKKNVVTWSVMIAGYAQHGCSREAFGMYEQMIQKGVPPDKVTFICILNACASLGTLGKGKEVHADITKAGIARDIVLETALTDMYAKCGSIQDARQVFDNMAQRNVVSWNAMITGYAQHGCGREALEIYEQMQLEGVIPNKVTFVSVLSVCGSLAGLEKGKEVHADIVKAGIVSDITLDTALVEMYAKCGNVKDAHKVFNNMVEQDVVSWSAMMAAYAQQGYGREALQLFEQMQQEGLKPDSITFISLLSACSHVGLVDEGHHYFDSMNQDHGLTPTLEHFGCIVDLLGRAGHLKEAEDFIEKMPIEPDASVWGALLGACRIHGNVELAEHAAKNIVEANQVC